MTTTDGSEWQTAQHVDTPTTPSEVKDERRSHRKTVVCGAF